MWLHWVSVSGTVKRCRFLSLRCFFIVLLSLVDGCGLVLRPENNPFFLRKDVSGLEFAKEPADWLAIPRDPPVFNLPNTRITRTGGQAQHFTRVLVIKLQSSYLQGKTEELYPIAPMCFLLTLPS